MKNIHRKAAAAILSASCMLSMTSTAYAAAPSKKTADIKVASTVAKNKTGTLTLNYKDDSEGKKPVAGAEFTLYKIRTMLMPITGPVVNSTASVADAGNGATGTYIGSNEYVSTSDAAGKAGDTQSGTGTTAQGAGSTSQGAGQTAGNGATGTYIGSNEDPNASRPGSSSSGYASASYNAPDSGGQKTATNGTNAGNGSNATSGATGKYYGTNGSKAANGDAGNYYGSGSKDANSFAIADRILNAFASETKAATKAKKTSASGTQVGVKTYYKPLIKGVAADYTVNPVKVEKKVRAAYRKGVKGGKHYRVKTNASGYAKLTGISQGLYLAVETKPAKEHFASIPFIVSMPQMIYKNTGVKQGWCFNVIAYPKSLPGGDLKITKKVTGNDGEKNKLFHFNVKLDLSKARSTSKKTSADRYTDKYASGRAPNGYHTAQSFIKSKKYGRTYDRAAKKYKYVTSDGRKGTIGTKGTIALKSGQTATIKCIPIGTAYKVTEQEANKNRYKTKVKNEEGAIRQHKPETVSFINNRTKPVRHPAKPSRPSHPSRPGHHVKTGDNAKLTIYIAMLAAAAAAVILSLRRIIRKRKED